MSDSDDALFTETEKEFLSINKAFNDAASFSEQLCSDFHQEKSTQGNNCEARPSGVKSHTTGPKNSSRAKIKNDESEWEAKAKEKINKSEDSPILEDSLWDSIRDKDSQLISIETNIKQVEGSFLKFNFEFLQQYNSRARQTSYSEFLLQACQLISYSLPLWNKHIISLENESNLCIDYPVNIRFGKLFLLNKRFYEVFFPTNADGDTCIQKNHAVTDNTDLTTRSYTLLIELNKRRNDCRKILTELGVLQSGVIQRERLACLLKPHVDKVEFSNYLEITPKQEEDIETIMKDFFYDQYSKEHIDELISTSKFDFFSFFNNEKEEAGWSSNNNGSPSSLKNDIQTDQEYTQEILKDISNFVSLNVSATEESFSNLSENDEIETTNDKTAKKIKIEPMSENIVSSDNNQLFVKIDQSINESSDTSELIVDIASADLEPLTGKDMSDASDTVEKSDQRNEKLNLKRLLRGSKRVKNVFIDDAASVSDSSQNEDKEEDNFDDLVNFYTDKLDEAENAKAVQEAYLKDKNDETQRILDDLSKKFVKRKIKILTADKIIRDTVDLQLHLDLENQENQDHSDGTYYQNLSNAENESYSLPDMILPCSEYNVSNKDEHVSRVKFKENKDCTNRLKNLFK